MFRNLRFAHLVSASALGLAACASGVAIDDGDSRLSQLVPILRDLRGGNATAETVKAINSLDSFGEQLQPILLALAHM